MGNAVFSTSNFHRYWVGKNLNSHVSWKSVFELCMSYVSLFCFMLIRLKNPFLRQNIFCINCPGNLIIAYYIEKNWFTASPFLEIPDAPCCTSFFRCGQNGAEAINNFGSRMKRPRPLWTISRTEGSTFVLLRSHSPKKETENAIIVSVFITFVILLLARR